MTVKILSYYLVNFYLRGHHSNLNFIKVLIRLSGSIYQKESKKQSLLIAGTSSCSIDMKYISFRKNIIFILNKILLFLFLFSQQN